MTVSQKRAIWYKERDKRNASIDAFIRDYKLDFTSSGYKYRIWFIKHIMKELENRLKHPDMNIMYMNAWRAINGKYGR